MSKYFDTKPGSLEEATKAVTIKEDDVQAKARQLMRRDGKDPDRISDGGVFQRYRDMAKRELGIRDQKEQKLDPVNPKAAAKKFDDRKDKDIDNDGDVDSSDKFLHKRRKAVSKAIGEEISPDEYESIIETLSELSPALLKRARDAAKAKSQRADDRSMKMRKLGKGDSDLTKKLDKETDKKAAQARKFDRAADDARYDRMDKGADKLAKGPKSKNPDVDDYGKTKADKVRDGNVKSKDAEKERRKDAAAGQKQGSGSLGATDRNVAKQGDAYSRYQAKGGKLNRNDYLKRFGKSIKREDFETDAEWEAHLLEVQKVYDAMSVREKWEDAYRQVQERNKIKEDEHEMDDEKPMKKGKTATGKKPDEIEMNPDMEDEGYHKKKK